MAPRGELPAWVNLGLLPLLNLAAAFLVSGLIVLLLGENPLEAVELLVYGAFGYAEAIGYTLFYATSFIFTGLAVAIAFHCGLFNIGGEGQAYVGGLGVALVGLYLGWLPWLLVVPLAIEVARSPLNLSFLFALVCCVLFWLFVWQTRFGYALRVVGQNETAAVYGGISPARQIMLAMTISGALAGFVALNMIMGDQHRLTLDFTGGFGFVGIAVALMGRSHPVGIVLAALLFGALYQGGSELSFDMPALSRDLVVVIQGLVILFAGALEHMFRPYVEALFARPAPAEAVA